MRNLTVHRIGRRDLQFMKNPKVTQELLDRIQCAINPNSNEIYVLLDENLYIISIGNRDIVTLNFCQYRPSEIITMDYCITLQELYCAYKSGHIAKLDIRDPKRLDYTSVTTFKDGLQCMKFSPDHELIAAVTNIGNVITMVLDFQVMSEVILFGFNSNFCQILLLSCI